MPTSLQFCMEYFYFRITDSLTLEDVAWIVHYADTYCLNAEILLMERCNRVLNTSVNSSNWMYALRLGVDVQSVELQDAAMKAMSPRQDVIPHLVGLARDTLVDNRKLWEANQQSCEKIQQLGEALQLSNTALQQLTTTVLGLMARVTLLEQ